MGDRFRLAGLNEVQVGTVDKVQGREAPAVLFSLAAFSIDEVARGISFLLNRIRVIVLISCEKCAAYIDRSPRLTEYLPTSPVGLAGLGAFLALTDHQSDEESGTHGQ